jgi:hypothetical protein
MAEQSLLIKTEIGTKLTNAEFLEEFTNFYFKMRNDNDLIIFLDNLDKRELCRTKSMYFIPLKGEFVDLNSFRLTNTNNGDLKFRYKVDRREFGEGVAYLYMQRCV